MEEADGMGIWTWLVRVRGSLRGYLLDFERKLCCVAIVVDVCYERHIFCRSMLLVMQVLDILPLTLLSRE